MAFVTVLPSLCACPFDVPAVAVPFAPLVIPVKSEPAIPVYVINSLPTAIVPAVGKPDVDVKVIAVPDPPVPAVSASKAPFKVVVVTPDTVPP